MNKDTLIQLFKAPYNRQAFIDNALLPTFRGKVANLKIFDAQGVQEKVLSASEQHYAVSIVKYGEFQTLDALPRTVELFEVIVNNNKQIERSRVGLGALVKKHIIGNNAVLVNFAYQSPEKRSWRFSFIARDGVFQDGEMLITDTHPKRYTYVFGEKDETYKTALDRFFILGNELEITINKIKDAFGVEAMSKAFFDEYRDVHYAGFVDYLMRSHFKKSAFNGNDKDVRDFVKKLLGRIVFLYFLQKKGWLGAKDTSYKNGDKNFMTNFFKKAGANDAFYTNWLSKLFFDALNNERPNDDFTMPDGEVVKIPYLNGGLFENESSKYDFLTFPSDLFTNLFEFFDQYNFTIFEDSPEEHTVAVDPEMLGHIFENLLEDNKDKGAFYTPKEIVHYMTQESLIEYLHTQIPEANRGDIEHFVKNKVSTTQSQLSAAHKKLIDQKLDAVKICDPAIGSGAFPMGLLQEIFGLKERIAYELGYKVWSPATVKENIIQKSIYGVDIERGAVDIARLRFWLSLIVDEEMPKALPNLDYKIVVGNSLVSKFDDTVIEIDWDRKGSVGEADKHVQGVQNALKNISEKQKQFFESKSNSQKAKLKAEIRDLKLDVLMNQLSFNKTFYLNKNQKVTDMGFGLKATDHKKNLEIDLQMAEFNQALAKLQKLKENPDLDFNHFDWKLDFPEVLNPLVNEETGFDIVIGNPPYIKEYTSREAFDGFRSSPYYQGKMDIWYGFACKALDLLKDHGVECFIAQNNWITSSGASKLREKVLKEAEIKLFTDFWNYKVFASAGIQTMIYLLKKSYPESEYELKYSVLEEDKLTTKQLYNFLDFDLRIGFGKKFIIKHSNTKFDSKQIDFNSGDLDEILEKIKRKQNFSLNEKEIAQGIVPNPDVVNSRNIVKIPNDVVVNNNIKVGDGVFVLDKGSLDGIENYLKPMIEPNETGRYLPICNYSKEILYLTKGNYNGSVTSIQNHLSKYRYIMEDRRENLSGRLEFFHLHWPREETFFKTGPKILSIRKCDKPSFTFTEKEVYPMMAFNIIKTCRIDNRYLTGLFNSKLIEFWLRYKGKMQGANYQIDKEPILDMPIVINQTITIASLVELILFINETKITILNSIPNKQISEAFEEVIDALVFELYFPEDFAEKGIAIEKYAQDIFKPIEGLSEEEQIKAIQEAYETLREKDNPLRNQMAKMYAELNELLEPILKI
ncbi:Eco57I restriction-modification methylase domain-containing protein [Flavobacterium sp.]|uniref:Eco57I restriction-modification methylase domain-containing protein n=1 Tax=Flavobacterium sp. TaxID=239 RepID=UPI003B9AED80